MQPSTPIATEERVSRALNFCRVRIAALSSGGKILAPPPVKNYGTPPEFYFVWPKGMFSTSDGDGVLNPAAATCRGNIFTGLITELSMNGVDVTRAAWRNIDK